MIDALPVLLKTGDTRCNDDDELRLQTRGPSLDRNV